MLVEEPAACCSSSGSINTSLCNAEQVPLPLLVFAVQSNEGVGGELPKLCSVRYAVIFSYDMPSSLLVVTGDLEK